MSQRWGGVVAVRTRLPPLVVRIVVVMGTKRWIGKVNRGLEWSPEFVLEGGCVDRNQTLRLWWLCGQKSNTEAVVAVWTEIKH